MLTRLLTTYTLNTKLEKKKYVGYGCNNEGNNDAAFSGDNNDVLYNVI